MTAVDEVGTFAAVDEGGLWAAHSLHERHKAFPTDPILGHELAWLRDTVCRLKGPRRQNREIIPRPFIKLRSPCLAAVRIAHCSAVGALREQI